MPVDLYKNTWQAPSFMDCYFVPNEMFSFLYALCMDYMDKDVCCPIKLLNLITHSFTAFCGKMAWSFDQTREQCYTNTYASICADRMYIFQHCFVSERKKSWLY